MREVHLPVGVGEQELELAERVAVALRSQVLVVCWTARRESVSPRREPEAQEHPFAAIVHAVAGAWDAFIAPLHEHARHDTEL